MTKSKTLILAITAAFMSTLLAGCSTIANAGVGVTQPENSEPVSTEQRREIIYSDEIITVTVPEKYAALLYTDSLYSDDFFTVIVNVYYKPEYHEPDAYTAQTSGGWMLTVQSTREPVLGIVSSAPTIYKFFAGDGDVSYLEERPLEEYYHCTPDSFDEYSAILESIVIDFGNMQQVFAKQDDILSPPPYNDKSIDTAAAFADYYVNMLNKEQDLTGGDDAMNSWHDLFDFGTVPIYRGDLSKVEYSENVYQFIVSGKKGEITNSATVLINFQNDEPYYYCAYTRYYPYALSTATKYVELLAEDDIEKLAIWLSVDGGPNPSADFIKQARLGLLAYRSFDLHGALTTGIRFDNEAQRFYCDFEDSHNAVFVIPLSFGDGLIMPERDMAFFDTAVDIDYGNSVRFNQSEIEAAIETVIEKFTDFYGCEMRKIWYDESESEIRVRSYLTNGRGSDTGATQENVIVLLTDFCVPPSGGPGSLNPDSTYTTWMWILIRDNADSNWVVDDSGY